MVTVVTHGLTNHDDRPSPLRCLAVTQCNEHHERNARTLVTKCPGRLWAPMYPMWQPLDNEQYFVSTTFVTLSMLCIVGTIHHAADIHDCSLNTFLIFISGHIVIERLYVVPLFDD